MTSAVTPAVPPWLPLAFDDFEILRPLGAGGMGTVLLARDTVLDRLVAIKLVAALDMEARERFAIEARAVARLQHPNIVAVYRIGEVGDQPYLAYEYVEGQRLDELPRPASWQGVLGVALGLARGLAAAHARGVLHRDVKPANVMISSSGKVKLLDFGLARVVRPDTPPPTGQPPLSLADLEVDDNLVTAVIRGHAAGRLTANGRIVGTPLYLAPEVWLGSPATARADVYGMGLLLYELLTGGLPHAHLHGLELVKAILSRDLPPLTERLPHAPRPLTALIDRCVARHVERRAGPMSAIRDELEEMVSVYRPIIAAEHHHPVEDQLRASFRRVTEAGDRFADRLFEAWTSMAPEVMPLLGTDAGARRCMLGTALRMVVDASVHPERVAPLLVDLGRRHGHLGIDHRHFRAFEQALMAALIELDPEWNDAIAAAWAAGFRRVEKAMRRGLMASRAVPTPRVVPSAPRTRWTAHDGGEVAYQVLGHGPIDLVVVGEWVTHLEQQWHHPALAMFLRELSAIGRLIVFDRRGSGLSDGATQPTASGHAADLAAVLDATGSERAVLIAVGDGAAAAARLAAAAPERVRAMVLIAPPHPDELTASARDQAIAAIRDHWGEPLFLDRIAPTLSADPETRRWWSRLLRNAATPGAATALLRAAAGEAPPYAEIAAPTLVLHRVGDLAVPVSAGRRVAGAIDGARIEVLDGADHAPWSGDAAAVIRRIRAFVGDVPTEVAVTPAPSELARLDA